MPAPTTEKIIEQFNLSVNAVGKAYEASDDKKFNAILNEIALSAGYIYQTLEWFLKNYLYSVFPDAVTYVSEHTVIEAPSFPRKLSLFELNAIPTLPTVGIDITTIKELKASVRNNSEHSGITPHYNSLLIVIQTTRNLLETYLNIAPSRLLNLPHFRSIDIELSNKWLDFFNATEKFNKDYNYILVADLSNETENTIKPLGLINWNAIIDLDSNSEISGLYSSINNELSLKRSIHRYTLHDTLPNTFSDESCYWIYANGLNGRANTTFEAYRYWNSNYNQFLNRIFNKLQLAISSKPTVIVVLAENTIYSIDISKIIFNCFDANAKFVFATMDLNRYLSFTEQYEAMQVEISIPQLATGLLTVRRYFNPLINENEIVIPHKDSAFTTISQSNYTWLKEDLEVLHKYIVDESNDIEERIDFYKGGKLSWKGLMLNYDLNRENTNPLEAKVERSLRDRSSKIISFFHYPGIGGSSISKRVAWRLKDRFPVACMNIYRPVETINKIYELFQLSSLPPLVLMDSELIGTESRRRIYDEALVKSFPVTFLEIQRKIKKPTQLSTDQIYATDVLSDNEVFTFSKAYSELAINKKIDLEAIISSTSIQEKHPLFFGLTAFEENFVGVKNFVEKSIKEATIPQRKILSIICLSGIYAQKAISAQSFTPLLSLPESISVKLQDYLSEQVLHLIVKEENLCWRPLHYLIAKQFLKVIYGGTEEQMRVGLSDLSIEFIDLIGMRSSNPTTGEYEILNRLFIERYDEEGEEDEEKQFSKLIREGLYDDDAKLRVFIRLTEVFPEKVHYWSHLARFYNLVIKDQVNALLCINQAIELDSVEFQSKDSTLYHIKGMILKSQAGALMQKNWGKLSVEISDIDSIKDLIVQSNEEFEKARNFNIHSDYGFITDIDAITHYLDFKFKKSGYDERSYFLANLDDFDLRLFTKARLLLEEVRSKLHHNPNDTYYVRAKNKLQEYFDNYSAIIQSWQNLLTSNRNVDKFSVRQNLAHAYVNRANGWDKLDSRDIEKVLTLLADNIDQDPGNGKNIFLWFKAARYSNTLRIDRIIPKLVQWRISEQSIEASFYLSILYVIEAINGKSVAVKLASDLIREVSEKSRSYPFRSHASEWYGRGFQMAQLKTRNTVVSKTEGSKDLIFDIEKLKYIKGKIANIKGPENGEIEFASGLFASFIPARASGGKGFVKGRDQNKDVEFILGFSYDGLKAFDVNLVNKDSF